MTHLININSMFLRKKRQSVHAEVARVSSAYQAPRVLGETDVLLEQSLLINSVSYTSQVETAGQLNDGFYTDTDIVSATDNPWFD